MFKLSFKSGEMKRNIHLEKLCARFVNIGLCTIKMEEKSFFMKIAIKKPESITLIQFALNAMKK